MILPVLFTKVWRNSLKATFGIVLLCMFFYEIGENAGLKKKIPDCNVHVNKFLCDYSITNHKKHGNHNVLYLNRIHVKDEKNLGCLVFKCYVGQKTKSSCGKRK